MTGKKIKFLFHFVHMCFIKKTDCKICASSGSANALRTYKIKGVLYIFFEISRFRIVLFKILTEMESVFNWKDCDIKYVLERVTESCLKLG